MDVTCERCGTEYDFDETLVSERGTTVKCTNCGHLFKVFRPGAQAADASGARPWAIRRRDGATETLATLRDLQRRITEGGLSEEDLISRSGDGWKRLGDIAELETFFQAARAAKAAAPARRDATASGFATAKSQQSPYGQAPSSRPGPPDPKFDPRAVAPTQEMMQPPAPPSRGSGARALPEPPRTAPPSRSATTMGVGSTPPPARKQTMMGVGLDSGAAATVPAGYADATVPAAPSSRAIPATAEYPLEEVEKFKAAYSKQQASQSAAKAADPARTAPQGRAAARTLEETPPFPPSQVRPSTGSPGRLRVDDDDLEASAPKSGGGGARIAMVVLLIVAVLGGGVALGWSKIGPALGLVAEDDPAAQFIARGDELLASDETSGYGAAVSEYTKALAFRERDPRVLVALARVHAVWAQALRFDAQDLEARAPSDPALQGEATRVQLEVRTHAAEALRFSEDAVRQSPADAEAELALADAQRLSGDPRGARQHFDRARTLAPDVSAEGLRVGALVTADEGAGIGAAQELAAQAVAKDPALLRARIVLARALLAGGDISGASTQIEAVLTRATRHERATALRDAIARGVPPAAPVVAVADAGVVDAPAVAALPVGALPVGALPPEALPADVAAGTAAAGGTTSGGVPAGRDYSYYVDRGDRLQQETARAGEARRYFEAALALRPDGREALTGLGYCAMEQGDYAGAIARFRSPASSGYGEAMMGLGKAYRETHRDAEALAIYRDYLERFPNGPDATMARRWLSSLGGSTAPAGGGTEPGTGGGNTGGGGSTGGGTGGNTGGGGTGGGGTGDEPAPRPNELPAPTGTTTPPPSSDTPAVGTE